MHQPASLAACAMFRRTEVFPDRLPPSCKMEQIQQFVPSSLQRTRVLFFRNCHEFGLNRDLQGGAAGSFTDSRVRDLSMEMIQKWIKRLAGRPGFV
jgi:hypothetical protein